jgi:hypothetical protein
VVAVIVVMFGLFARGKGAAGGGDGGDAGIKSDAISSPAQFASSAAAALAAAAEGSSEASRPTRPAPTGRQLHPDAIQSIDLDKLRPGESAPEMPVRLRLLLVAAARGRHGPCRRGALVGHATDWARPLHINCLSTASIPCRALAGSAHDAHQV